MEIWTETQYIQYGGNKNTKINFIFELTPCSAIFVPWLLSSVSSPVPHALVAAFLLPVHIPGYPLLLWVLEYSPNYPYPIHNILCKIFPEVALSISPTQQQSASKFYF